MKRYTYILWMIFIAFVVGCTDDLDQGAMEQGEGMTEGMVAIRFKADEAPVIITRAGEAEQTSEPIENALVMVFKADASGDSILINRAYQQLTVDNKSVNIYLNAVEGQSLYAICNLSETQAEALLAKPLNTYKLSDLYNEFIEINVPDGAYSGKHVMSGGIPMELVNGTQLKKEYVIPIKRLTAQLNFNVLFDPINEGDEFAIGEMYIHQVPKGSMLMDRGVSYIVGADGISKEIDPKSWGYHHTGADEAIKDSLDICPYDYSYIKAVQPATAEARLNHFFGVKKADAANSSGIWLDYDIIKGGSPNGSDAYKTSYQMFENRQGRVYDVVDNWSELEGMVDKDNPEVGNLYKYYQQGKKRGLVGTDPDRPDRIFKRNADPNTGLYTVNQEEKGFPCATYLTIRGVYTRKNMIGGDDPVDVTYHIYLGADNYRDFNICRNHLYNYTITIRAVDQTDTRVDATSIGGLTVFGNFNRVLDAHPDVMQVLLYSPRDWTVRVEDPDATPWLELSNSPVYLPRQVGEDNEGRASFQLSGKAGLHYIYIHADEYIPEVNNPHENENAKARRGNIICDNGSGEPSIIPVSQYPAQMVICHIKYDIHLAREIVDTFYVERILEKKNLSWGFLNYWSFIMDDLIAAGQWDGLANTRRMYQTALTGDKWGVEPAYPVEKYPDGIPLSDGLGYALSKNRDRNGNGQIDYNEILWYWPAANELQALCGHMYNSGSNYYDAEYNQTVDMDWEMEPMNFHSSSPSSADPAGITPGFCYSVLITPNTKKTGKKTIGMRSRFYNVICARRHPGWMGPNTGEVEGDVDIDPNWGEDDEQIMDKKK